MRFEEMRSPQLRQVDRNQTMVLFPIAACEQHGPHCPTGTDTILCRSIAEAVEASLPDNVLLLPTLWLGASAHHLRLGATLTAGMTTYIATLEDVLSPLLDDGYRRMLILNGHGGNVDPLRAALRNLQIRNPDVLLAGHSYWSMAADQIAALMEGEEKTVGHACEAETSLMLHLRPDLVDTEAIEDNGVPVADMIEGAFVCRDMFQRTRNGATGRADLATAEKGAAMFSAIVKRVGITIRRLLTEPLPE